MLRIVMSSIIRCLSGDICLVMMNSCRTNCTCSGDKSDGANARAVAIEETSVNVAEVILCDVSRMALLSHILPCAIFDENRLMIREVLMLDRPEKTRHLMATLEAAVPFEVVLMP